MRPRCAPALVVAVLLALAAPVGAQAPPPPVTGGTYTQAQAVDFALAGQPQIQARLYDYAAARFRVDQALSPLLPQLSSSWTTLRSRNTVISTTGGGGTGKVPIDRNFDETSLARVSLSQLLFDFGKTMAATEAARKLSEIAREDVELQRQLVALAVKEAYTNVLFGQRLIRVQQQALDRAELNLRSARGFFEVGTRPKSDVARAEVDLANARLDLIRARNAERLARAALNTAMGLGPDVQLTLVDPLAYEPFSIEPLALRREALDARPEYRQARLGIDVAEANERGAFRSFFPDVTAGGNYGGSTQDFNETWEINLALTWSIFDGGNRIARYREAQQKTEASQARLRALELDILKEVEQASAVVQESEERIQAAQAAVASAQENFRLAQGRFDAGVGTILELTDAQLALTVAQNTEAQALADSRIARYRLERAIGRR